MPSAALEPPDNTNLAHMLNAWGGETPRYLYYQLPLEVHEISADQADALCATLDVTREGLEMHSLQSSDSGLRYWKIDSSRSNILRVRGAHRTLPEIIIDGQTCHLIQAGHPGYKKEYCLNFHLALAS